MHAQMDRLYLAVQTLRGGSPRRTGPTAIAELLGESPQTVTNWENRGISQRGAVLAQTRIGCDARWLLTGEGEMVAATAAAVTPQGMPDLVAAIAQVASGMDEATREALGVFLKRAATNPDEAEMLAKRVKALVGE